MSDELKIETFILKQGDDFEDITINEVTKARMLDTVNFKDVMGHRLVYYTNKIIFPDDPMFEREELSAVKFTKQSLIFWYVDKICNHSIVKDLFNYDYISKDKILMVTINDDTLDMDELIDMAVRGIGYIFGYLNFVGESSSATLN